MASRAPLQTQFRHCVVKNAPKSSFIVALHAFHVFPSYHAEQRLPIRCITDWLGDRWQTPRRDSQRKPTANEISRRSRETRVANVRLFLRQIYFPGIWYSIEVRSACLWCLQVAERTEGILGIEHETRISRGTRRVSASRDCCLVGRSNSPTN